jgi:hypothetical protein
MRRNTYFSRSLVEALLSADTRTGERRTESEVLNKRGPWSYHVPVLAGWLKHCNLSVWGVSGAVWRA